jgi:hypothetical protein
MHTHGLYLHKCSIQAGFPVHFLLFPCYALPIYYRKFYVGFYSVLFGVGKFFYKFRFLFNPYSVLVVFCVLPLRARSVLQAVYL